MSWPVFATVYWFGAMGYFAAILLTHRWMTLHGYRWTRVAYFIAVLAVIATATDVGDELCISGFASPHESGVCARRG